MFMALNALLRDSMVYLLRVVALSPQIFVYWNTATHASQGPRPGHFGGSSADVLLRMLFID